MSGLRINREDLVFALTWRTEEGGHFLDREPGELTAWTGTDDPEHTEAKLDAGLAEGRLLPIDPLDSSVEYGWMEEFVTSVADSGLARQLESSIRGSGAFRRFKDVLAGRPAECECERSFAFRDERAREAAREWLEDNRVEADELPRGHSRK